MNNELRSTRLIRIARPSTANSAARPKNARNGSRTNILTCTSSCIVKVRASYSVLFPSSHTPHPFLSTTNPPVLVLQYTAAVAATLSTLSVDAQKRAQKDTAKKEAKAAQQEKRAAEDKAAAKVLIKRVERNKRKYVTAVSGLEAHGLDLKKVAKEWGKKFATGSSVTKTASKWFVLHYLGILSVGGEGRRGCGLGAGVSFAFSMTG